MIAWWMIRRTDNRGTGLDGYAYRNQELAERIADAGRAAGQPEEVVRVVELKDLLDWLQSDDADTALRIGPNLRKSLVEAITKRYQ